MVLREVTLEHLDGGSRNFFHFTLLGSWETESAGRRGVACGGHGRRPHAVAWRGLERCVSMCVRACVCVWWVRFK